jgi:hypothetical protein
MWSHAWHSARHMARSIELLRVMPLAHASHLRPLRSRVRRRVEQVVSLLTDLDAFYTDHRLCGELDAGVDEPMVWFVCACGARIHRPVATSCATLAPDRERHSFAAHTIQP